MKLLKRTALAIAVSTLISGVAAAEPSPAETIEEVTVYGIRGRLYETGVLKDVIQKTEVVSDITMEKRNAMILTEAIAYSPGVRVNNECSMCGVKRVMLNGLRGEHTTVLTDGIPTHTMMSGFYGLDAVAAAGLARVELARGSGASLIAPEAIGGSVNLVTREATANGIDLDFAGGEIGYRRASAVATGITDSEATRVTLSAQVLERAQFDGDSNGVSESPETTHQSFTAYLSQDLGDSDNLRLRVSRVDSEIFGGPTNQGIDTVLADFLANPDFESEQLFEGGDVRNQYVGRGWETSEWIDTARTELYASWLHEFSSDVNVTVTGSYNEHEQDSFYEGFIYDADNEMMFFDARVNWAVSDTHLLTFGADSRLEELRSQTNSTSSEFESDSFDYDVLGLYVQDTWNVNDKLEIAAAVRFDSVEADFVDPSKPGMEIDDDIFAPRIDIRYAHNMEWTSRISAGRGFRAPLSFFESDHGILDAELGFFIDIDELERSNSASYSLSFEGERLSASGGIAWTQVENLAALDETDAGVPVLTQLDEDAKVLVADLALTWRALDQLSLGATLETIKYDDAFKSAFGVVPVEERLVLTADWEMAGWDLFTSATWVGERNLASYGTPENPTFDAAGTLPMDSVAEAFWNVDMRVARNIGDRWQIYAGATNLFGWTQTEDAQTPLFFDEGAYDVAYIFGPLRGREAYAGIKYSFR